MVSSKTFLNVLEFPPSPTQRNLPGDVDELVISIRQHLQLMLNTRKGSSYSAPDFGTSDFADFFRGSLSLQVIQEEIRKCVAKYEPRLSEVQVNFHPVEDDPFRLHFDIMANIVTEDDETPTVFHSVLEGSGAMTGKVLFLL